MKTIAILFTALLLGSGTVSAETNNMNSDSSINNYVRGYSNSFIFIEDGIEFSVFRDGQFDFYMPTYGPNLNVGYNSPNVSITFNSGYDYNPYVQYDSFGAIIQIENTPIFYDYYGRVSRVGNIFINYNGFGRIVQIGGLRVFYRNNVYTHYNGYINSYNRFYVYRPWHRFYAVPVFDYCVVNTFPYRQYYAPVRHIYYRPYSNNVRHYNVNGRRANNNIARRGEATRISDRYKQTPRNSRERETKRRVETRRSTSSFANNTRNDGTRQTGRTDTRRTDVKTERGNSTRTRTTGNTRDNSTRTRTNSETKVNTSRTRNNNDARTNIKRTKNSVTKNVTRTSPSVSKKVDKRNKVAVRKPNTNKTRISNNSSPRVKQTQRSTVKKNKSRQTSANKSSSVKRSATKTNSRRIKT